MSEISDRVKFITGDCIGAMRAMDENSVDAIVTDPPYNLNFMAKAWDRNLNHGIWAVEALRVLKPGGHLLAFGGTRTYHRLACAIEDAGFEIRDTIAWLYGSGFPKSLDVSKAIDKAAGAEREVVGSYDVTRDLSRNGRTGDEAISPIPVTGTTVAITAPATPDAERWQGWGTALKPAHEPIVVARKPLSERNVAKNVLRHGTGGLNIDGTRIEGVKDVPASPRRAEQGPTFGDLSQDPGNGSGWNPQTGRWPANVTLDEEAAAMLDEQSGIRTSGQLKAGTVAASEEVDIFGARPSYAKQRDFGGDSGGASRFYYCAKAGKKERNAGVPDGNGHPTVKPVALMRWLVRMVTPPDGLVLDPFCGSGTTAVAAISEGMRVVAIDREREYVEIAARRTLHHWREALVG